MTTEPNTGLDEQLVCPSCGRDYAGYEGDDAVVQGEPCPSDDCPSYWEEIGVPYDPDGFATK